MRKFEPDFDLFEFENEVDEVLKQVLDAFFKDDLDTLQKLTANEALGQLTGIIRARKEMVIIINLSIIIIISKQNVSSRKSSILIKLLI